MPPPTNTPHHHEAARTLRRHTRGVTRADGTPRDCRFLIDGQSGELVLGLDREAVEAAELVLFLPDDTFDAEASVLINHRPAEEDRWTDRHMAYHPEARPDRWARATVDSLKLRDGEIVEGDRLALVNPLLSVEPALCKRLNADRDRVRELCRLMAGVEPEQPVAVGVDRYGIDVRARFGIVRLDLPAPCDDPDEAVRVIDALIENAR
ncbi:MAG: DUF2470 domain-containing protein [Phycisphaerales bacterium]|nr:hypothetical protein [Planctomycetota bacterium]MCH8509629.1 DUF2470 domain-containing protein [Phycisphaerales bacterium]